MTKRYVGVCKIKPEHVEEYKRLHRGDNVDEYARFVRAANVRNHSIYLYGDLLIYYYEYTGSDHESDMKSLEQDTRYQDWKKRTDPMKVPCPEAGAGKMWHMVEEICHVD
jgi:L-rhamnose mutarotase